MKEKIREHDSAEIQAKNHGNVIHVRVPKSILELIDAVAKSRGLSRSSFVREAILLDLLPFLPIEQQEHIRGKYQ